MNLCIKIPARLKFKRFNKTYSKIRYSVDHSTLNFISNSSQFVCGIKALNHGFLTSKLLNFVILLLRRAVGKGRIGWPRVRLLFNLRVPVTRKSAGHRMGKGKGSVKHWGVPIKAGSFVFKIQKSPRKSFFFSNFVWTNLYSFFEFLDTTSFVYDQLFYVYKKYNVMDDLELYFSSFHLFKANILYTSFLRYLFKKVLFFFTNLFSKRRKKLKILYKFYNFFKGLNVKKKKFRVLKPSNSLLFFLLAFNFQFYKSFFFMKKQHLKFFLRKRKMQMLTLLKSYKEEEPEEFYDLPYLENRLLAQYTQTFSATKISYLPSLYRGLLRVKNKLPFSSEIYFFDHKSRGCSFYKLITKKRLKLKHLNQR